jgi:hypothetical protein
MIGVIADPAENEVVREFFELFKTPWEFYHENRQYEVLLCGGSFPFDATAKLVVFYAGKKTSVDRERGIPIANWRGRQSCFLAYHGNRIPVYCDTVTFERNGSNLLVDEHTQECAAYLEGPNGRFVARIGYDLFSEVRTLLTVGQPAANANLPALELHIGFLRDLITRCGVPLTEIPPVPEGYRFIACLTHDVDHPSIRRHKWDHTMFGFLYRAVFSSFLRFIRGQLPVGDLLANWSAALKLPFVYLGLAKDFWREFADRYLELEKDLPSTFFVIPFKDCPGQTSAGPAPAFRAARYEAKEIADAIHKLMDAGCEVGLHGIDAWLDSSEGKKELEEIRRVAGASETGVRMHWLYFNRKSPVVLEEAGAAYDSTVGYNETVGYRAGTTQAYKPLGANRILELPMHIMDTALFYPHHLGLSAEGARALFDDMAENVVRFGGCLTINWHDRSVSPERLWSTSYLNFIQDLKARGAWFATACEAVSWFRKRRSVVFEEGPAYPSSMQARISSNCNGDLPGLRMRTYKEQKLGEIESCRSRAYVDIVFPKGTESQVSLNVSR